MSGIVGIYHPDGKPVDPMDLQRMVDRLAHRGPDGRHIWYEGSVGLGHCMLQTTPESLHENFPMTSRCGNFVLTADARIDNRDELISALRPSRSNGHPITDGELILLAYEKWGEDCPKHLLGDFAFAIWDKTRRHVFCARDHVGARLFAYYTDARTFIFSTEASSLRYLPHVPNEPDTLKVADHLLFPVRPNRADTFFRGIKNISPGHYYIQNQASNFERPFWHLDPDKELYLSNDEEYSDALRHTFHEAVLCRMRTTGPLGVYLSGGLDSSSIAAIAATNSQHSGAGITTYSGVFDTMASCDERLYINHVSKAFGIRGHSLPMDRFDPLYECETLYPSLSGPVVGPNDYIGWVLAKKARETGCKVMLSGTDGDTALSHGTGIFFELFTAGRWASLVREIRNYEKVRGRPWVQHLQSVLTQGRRGRPEYGRGWNRMFLYLMLLACRTISKNENPTLNLKSYLEENFISKLEDIRHPRSVPLIERHHHYRKLTSMAVMRAIESINAHSAQAGIDIRMPFFDKRLIELTLAMPADQKIRNGLTRVSFRRAMKNALPDQLRLRPGKTDLSPNATRGIHCHLETIRNMISSGEDRRIFQYVSRTGLELLMDNFEREAYNTNMLGFLWATLSLDSWLETSVVRRHEHVVFS